MDVRQKWLGFRYFGFGAKPGQAHPDNEGPAADASTPSPRRGERRKRRIVVSLSSQTGCGTMVERNTATTTCSIERPQGFVSALNRNTAARADGRVG